VVLGFSLIFLNRWAGEPGSWQLSDLAAVGLIIAGTALQLKALVEMLRIGSVLPEKYNWIIKFFFAGLGLVSLGILVALAEDVLGYGQHIIGG